MFVVKIVVDSEKSDFKAFEKKEDARQRFLAGHVGIMDMAYESSTLYLVPDETDVRKAVDAVKKGAAGVIVLERQPLPLPDVSDLDL